MRFYFGKKIGGMYVGTSVKGSTVGKVILYFFTWPFILLYFILIWPFVKLFQYIRRKRGEKTARGELKKMDKKKVGIIIAAVVAVLVIIYIICILTGNVQPADTASIQAMHLM